MHPARADPGDDVEPIFAEVRLAADQRDLEDAEVRDLIDEVERLVASSARRVAPSRARPTMATREIAGQRDLPHRIDRTLAAIDVARLVGERQAARSLFGATGAMSEPASAALSPATSRDKFSPDVGSLTNPPFSTLPFAVRVRN